VGFEQLIAPCFVRGFDRATVPATGTWTALFFSVINNALNMFGVAAYWQNIAVGVILVTALGIEAVRGRSMGLART
jgi:ribose/xylose/arabinose/galactoside ABC-type transport system permease subunit